MHDGNIRVLRIEIVREDDVGSNFVQRIHVGAEAMESAKQKVKSIFEALLMSEHLVERMKRLVHGVFAVPFLEFNEQHRGDLHEMKSDRTTHQQRGSATRSYQTLISGHFLNEQVDEMKMTLEGVHDFSTRLELRLGKVTHPKQI